MNQALLVTLLGVLLGLSTADKRPLGQALGLFAFQRQQAPASGPETEDLSPPAAPGGAAGAGGPSSGPNDADSSGPYPPSGQPAGGPYPPSGWKPQGQRLELPPRPPRPSQQRGPPKPQQKYGPPPKKPQQQYGPPPKQPQQQYGPPPKQPQQQYGPPATPAEPEATDASPVEPSTESPDQVAVNNKLRQQLRQQRVALQRLRLQVREQQSQLELLQQLRGVDPQRVEAQQQQQQQLDRDRAHLAEQGQYVVALPDGRLQQVQFASTPSSASVFRQSVHEEPLGRDETPATVKAATAAEAPATYVARLQFMDVPPIDAPIFSYSASAPFVQVT